MAVEDERKIILEIQKELMSSILEYQIRNGSGSVVWNVSVQFIEKQERRQG